MKIPFFPDQASSLSAQVDYLFFFLVALSVFFIVVIVVPMFYFLVKYRRGRRANRATLRIPMNKIEVAWIVVPLILAMGVFAWGAHVYFQLLVPPDNALELNVVGKQWMWKVQHQEGNREINELHVPIGRPVRLTLASEDVIHSFFVPAFRVKQDVVPGRFLTQWFTPTRVGQYHLFCAELCGTDHSRMVGTVHVMNPADYEEWLNQGSVGDSLAQSGAQLYRELGCSGCHVGPSTVRAPRLEGLYGKMVPLQNGQIVRANDQYIRDSILLPNSQVTAGYEPLMPTFQGRITEEELFQLIAYIKSAASTPPEGGQRSGIGR